MTNESQGQQCMKLILVALCFVFQENDEKRKALDSSFLSSLCALLLAAAPVHSPVLRTREGHAADFLVPWQAPRIERRSTLMQKGIDFLPFLFVQNKRKNSFKNRTGKMFLSYPGILNSCSNKSTGQKGEGKSPCGGLPDSSSTVPQQ